MITRIKKDLFEMMINSEFVDNVYESDDLNDFNNKVYFFKGGGNIYQQNDGKYMLYNPDADQIQMMREYKLNKLLNENKND